MTWSVRRRGPAADTDKADGELVSPLRRAAGWTATVAALVYVAIKGLWAAGGTWGVADMRGYARSTWIAENLTTGGLGVMGAAVALVTVSRWGSRCPLWLVALPMWAGGGLLAPFVVLMPAAVLLTTAGWWEPPPSGSETEPLLEPWLFVIVYGSFIVLGIALTVSVALYAQSRFGTIVRGPVAQSAPGATYSAQVPLAWAAAALATGLAALRLWWVIGGDLGLLTGQRDAWLRTADAVAALQLLAAAAGIVVLVHRWGGSRPFMIPLTAVWLGAGGMVAAGGLSMPDILSEGDWAPSGQSFSMYAWTTFLSLVAGAVISLVAVMLLAERQAQTTTVAT